MAEDRTLIHVVERDQPLEVTGSLGDTQSALAAGAGNMVLRGVGDGTSLIVNPQLVTRLETLHTSAYEVTG